MSTAAKLLTAFQSYLVRRDETRVNEFVADLDWSMLERSLAPRNLPVVSHLKSAALPETQREADLVSLLASAADMLQWGQTYSSRDFGDTFLARYGWVELFGTRGHFESDVVAGGFLLLGPEIHYPDHHHIAEEIYIPLTSGSLWSKDGGTFAEREAGEVIYHPSNIRHAMRTKGVPLVALYLWRGGPLAQKSIISGRDT